MISTKWTTDDLYSVDVRHLNRQGRLIHGRSPIIAGYVIALTWTSCRYGGARPWFLCPHCGRRVALLYFAPQPLCRHCLDLAYPSQNETRLKRRLRKLRKQRDRLGVSWDMSISGFLLDKPKHMQWETFERLVREHEHLRKIWVEQFMATALDPGPCTEEGRRSSLEALQRGNAAWRASRTK